MKKIALLSLALAALSATGWADNQLRNVQTELKNLGFYYGDANGQQNAETTAAIRRYQIRNGLEVTGTLNQETLAALKMGPAKAPAPATKTAPPAPTRSAEKKAPPVDLRRPDPVEESDRDFLRRSESGTSRTPDAVAPLSPVDPPPPRDEAIIDAPAPLAAPSPDFPVLFAGTPYASAPLSVQRSTLRKAQSLLASRGFYRDIVDGLPGPATEEALLTFQRANRLTLTGRLDTDTLSALRLAPRSEQFSTGGSRWSLRIYRGVWVDR